MEKVIETYQSACLQSSLLISKAKKIVRGLDLIIFIFIIPLLSLWIGFTTDNKFIAFLFITTLESFRFIFTFVKKWYIDLWFLISKALIKKTKYYRLNRDNDFLNKQLELIGKEKMDF